MRTCKGSLQVASSAVDHNSVNCALLAPHLDEPLAAYWQLAQDSCTLNEVVIEGDKVKILRVNDTSHLN